VTAAGRTVVGARRSLSVASVGTGVACASRMAANTVAPITAMIEINGSEKPLKVLGEPFG
jgi:hypothetical protein